ncbi:suppressor of fused domain protein [Brevibacterium litoralis]|uniref:suppressor of fused domain protein n=1 Tax=Brevibacterium litoralis TaxID=3138935 RepID=UPI0032EE1B50
MPHLSSPDGRPGGEPVAPRSRRTAKHLVSHIGGRPRVDRYYRQFVGSTEHVDVLSLFEPTGLDDVDPGETAVATLGLAALPTGRVSATGVPLRVELLSPGRRLRSEGAATEDPGTLILTCTAFAAADLGRVVEPGQAYVDALATGRVADRHTAEPDHVRHVYLTSPFGFERVPAHVEDDIRITWLTPVAITDAELQYLRDHGEDALEEALDRAAVDTLDLRRGSVV